MTQSTISEKPPLDTSLAKVGFATSGLRACILQACNHFSSSVGVL